MMTFAELFREGQKSKSLDNGELARSKAKELLSSHGITLKTDLTPISLEAGAVVGIAFYSLPDLKFLDQLVLACRDKKLGNSVIVFDVLSCKTMTDFEKLIPGVGSVYQTPVVGIWRDGELVETGIGAKGRMLVVGKGKS